MPPVRVAALLLGGFIFCAAADPPEAAVNPDSLAAAHELLTAMNAQSNALAMFKSLRGVLIQNIQTRSNKPTDEVASIVDEVLMPEIESRMSEFIDMLAGVQASVYTVDEMHQLEAFYESPIGKRTIELTPKIGAMSFAAGQEWGKRVALDALQKNAEELRRRGVKL
jgi:hypothetical protein